MTLPTPNQRRAVRPTEECHWIDCVEAGSPPFATAYRCRFSTPTRLRLSLEVTADERYELFMDGQRIGRGSERGDAAHWFFERYKVNVAPGSHVLVARVWALGEQAPFAQATVRPGLFVRPDQAHTARVGTGHARWEAKPLPGYTFTNPKMAWGTGAKVDIDGNLFPWGFEHGTGKGWKTARILEADGPAFGPYGTPQRRQLFPARLPPMLERVSPIGTVRHVDSVPSFDTHTQAVQAIHHRADEARDWQRSLAKGTGLTLPPRTLRRVLIDIGDYCCAYPDLVVSGGRGSTLQMRWAEALFVDAEGNRKGHRDEIEGRHFVGVGDTFRPDGGSRRHFDTLWWQAGRYIEIVVQTAAAPLTIERLTLRETRYPLEMEAFFKAADPRLESVIPPAFRTLQMCSHETYMDCPYYEQLMYVGDTRLECLTTYLLTRDDRLPRKAIGLFDASRDIQGLTQSRYPSRVPQTIAAFSLWWVGMVYDYALWRDDREFVRQRLCGVRAVLETFMDLVSEAHLLTTPPGWNFVDWVPHWQRGIPPAGETGISGILNWHLVYTLRLGADLEEYAGEPLLARRLRLTADRVAAATDLAFWDEGRGLFADDLQKTCFSEHCQCLALLAGGLRGARKNRLAKALVESPDLSRSTIYFAHYLFESYRLIGRVDCLLDRMSLWFDAVGQGFKTTPEAPEPTRSDCHAWGAHPLYHYFATVLGIRPSGLGTGRICIEPQLGPLSWASGTIPHPLGTLRVEVRRQKGRLTGSVELPPELDPEPFLTWKPEVKRSRGNRSPK
jgi:hypothetical protein